MFAQYYDSRNLDLTETDAEDRYSEPFRDKPVLQESSTDSNNFSSMSDDFYDNPDRITESSDEQRDDRYADMSVQERRRIDESLADSKTSRDKETRGNYYITTGVQSKTPHKAKNNEVRSKAISTQQGKSRTSSKRVKTSSGKKSYTSNQEHSNTRNQTSSAQNQS